MPRRSRADAVAPITLFSFQDIIAAVTGIMILVTLLLALEPIAEEILIEERASAGATERAPVEEPAMALDLAERLVADLKAELELRRRQPAVDEKVIESLQARLAELREMNDEADARLSRAERSLEHAVEERDVAAGAEAAASAALADAIARHERETLRSRVRFLPGERFDRAPLFVEVRADGCVVGEFDGSGALAVIGDGRGDGPAPTELARQLGDRSPREFQLVFIVRQDALREFASLRDHFFERGWDVGWQIWDANEGGFFEPPEGLRP